MKKYGFLFGAGAELAYKLPTGGEFALDIFRQDMTETKRRFKEMRDRVNASRSYAGEWLPDEYQKKAIRAYGKQEAESIVSDTIEHNRTVIIDKINRFDEVAEDVKNAFLEDGTDVDRVIEELIECEVLNMNLSSRIHFNEHFDNKSRLFSSHYYSALLVIYKNMEDNKRKETMGVILRTVMQLQAGAMGEELCHWINEKMATDEEKEIDLVENLGDIFTLNYRNTGTDGLELLLDNVEYEGNSPEEITLNFALKILGKIYASIIDYKSLIDTNWHYLYCPKTDWAKFCKISLFLLAVRDYIYSRGLKADLSNTKGYYHMLKDVLNKEIQVSGIATTNYNMLIDTILGDKLSEKKITHLNGSTELWYDPYLNKIGGKEELDDDEHHIVVPLIFTQSGTKPMTSINMTKQYAELYQQWEDAEAIVVVGFGFGEDDEHINGMLRTLVVEKGKKLIVVTKDSSVKEIAMKLKIRDQRKITLLSVDREGNIGGVRWVDKLSTLATE